MSPDISNISKHIIHAEQILSLDLIMYSSIIKAFISISAQLAHTFPVWLISSFTLTLSLTHSLSPVHMMHARYRC